MREYKYLVNKPDSFRFVDQDRTILEAMKFADSNLADQGDCTICDVSVIPCKIVAVRSSGKWILLVDAKEQMEL